MRKAVTAECGVRGAERTSATKRRADADLARERHLSAAARFATRHSSIRLQFCFRKILLDSIFDIRSIDFAPQRGRINQL